MALIKRSVGAVTAATPQVLGIVGLGAKFGVLKCIRARNFADATKLAAGTDAALRLKIVDNHGTVAYLDAADRDYKTAEVVLYPVQDDTATGLTPLVVDATGAAAAAGQSADIVLESPVTVSAVNGGTATDFVYVELLVDVQRIEK